MSTLRIGHGYDAHRFGAGDRLTLGGVRIPFAYGIEAHSDGDVLIHSLCDALLGAAALGDIGRHFPDDDPQYDAVDSRYLLEKVRAMLTRQSYQIVNVDMTLLAQQPRLSPYIGEMRQNIASVLVCSEAHVSIKATTTEGMGFVGRLEGLAAHSVVLIERQ